MVHKEHDPTGRAAFGVLAAVKLVLGSWMALSPGTFTTRLAPFGARNDHLLRDQASWELALAAAALVALLRPPWRLPVAAMALIHFGLHAISHLIDVGSADPGWIGPADLALLVLGTGALTWLTRRSVAS